MIVAEAAAGAQKRIKATTATAVLVRGATTGHKDRAWAADLVPPNETTAFQGTATVIAADPGGGTPSGDLIRLGTATYFVPKWDQTFAYDDDGNLTNDSVWNYTYDAENRLVAMEHRSEVIGTGMMAAANARKLVFVYDYLGRRVRKTTYGGWNGSSYSATKLTDTKYLYDGWNLVAEFSVDSTETMTLLRAYTWGLDLTGSLTGAGGIGGLLQVYDAGVSKTLLPTFDGSGNVAAMVNAASGALEAIYEYDPYGNLLRKEGGYAGVNPIRYSSKYTDAESNLVYYGYRYYNTTLGRFINRDPIEESGGLNLYGFVSNRVPNAWDYLGMADGEGWQYGWVDDSGFTEIIYGAPSGMDVIQAQIGASGNQSWMSYAEGACATQLAAVIAYQTAQVNYAIGKVNDAAANVIGNVTANAVNQATAAAAGYLASNAEQAIASIGSTAYASLATGQASYSASTAGAVAANFSASQAPFPSAVDSNMMSLEEGMRNAPTSTSHPLDNLSPAEYAAAQGAIKARDQQYASQVSPYQAIVNAAQETFGNSVFQQPLTTLAKAGAQATALVGTIYAGAAVGAAVYPAVVAGVEGFIAAPLQAKVFVVGGAFRLAVGAGGEHTATNLAARRLLANTIAKETVATATKVVGSQR